MDEIEVIELKCKFCGAPLPGTPERKLQGFEFFRCKECGTSNVLPAPPPPSLKGVEL